ncbi:MAG: MlaD family protein, partial [Saezia sp.]
QIDARFTNLGTIKVGSAVKNAGVIIGRVRSVSINAATFEAVLSLELESKYSFPSDSSLRIMSSGLIGGQYVDISPGFDESSLEDATMAAFKKDGQYYTVTNTQSAFVLEDLIGKVLFSMAENAGSGGQK